MADYVSIRLDRTIADQVRRFTIQLSAATDARLSQSDALAAAIAYAGEHMPEITDRLSAQREKGTD